MDISPPEKLSAYSEKLQCRHHRVGKDAELIVF